MDNQNQTAKAPEAQKPTPRTQPVSISQVKQMLKDGISRKEIGTQFGLNHKQLMALFQNPKLKGLKTHSKTELPFELIDDEATVVEEGKVKTKPDAAASEDSKVKETTSEVAGVDAGAGW